MNNNKNMRNLDPKSEKKKIKKNKFSFKLFFCFLIFMIIFTVVTAPFTLLYGPFESAKRTFVGSAMQTMNHQWLATTFLSQERIDKILGTNKSEAVDEEVDKSLVSLPTKADDTIGITTLVGKEGAKFTGYAIIVNDPKRVKVGVSSKLHKMGEPTSQIAENYDAIAAINGGAFTDGNDSELWTANGGIPEGILISEGQDLNNSKNFGKGYVAAITDEGRLLAGEYDYNDLLKEGVTDALAFALPNDATPVLIQNSKPTPLSGDGNLGTAPKTMIGQLSNGAIVLVVLDSKIPGSRIAATLKEAQDVMVELGCVTAMVLDGGRSTTMYYDGEVVNEPSNTAGERPIASAFIVK